MKKLIITTIMVFAVSALSIAKGAPVAGGETNIGNGTEGLPADYGSAWFLGDKPIKYCIEVSETFGVSVAQIRQDIEESFETWRTYIIKKDVKSLGGDALKITANSAFSVSCNNTVDLKLYFGLQNEEVEKFKQQYINPLGFEQRTFYDSSVGWGKGFIWITATGSINPEDQYPDWRKPFRLRAILLHEIGHVLGNGHIQNTIMADDLSETLKYSDYQSSKIFNRIDGRYELYMCSYCGNRWSGLNNKQKHKEDFKKTFRLVMNREHVGIIKSLLIQDFNNEDQLRLFVWDDFGTEEFLIEMNSNISTFPVHSENVFKKSYRGTHYVRFASAWVRHARVTTISGDVYSLLIVRNAWASQMSITLLDGDQSFILFDSNDLM